MKPVVHTIPGYRVVEYILMLSPHEELRNRVMKVKEEFSARYKTEDARRGGSHLALVTFNQYEMMEERIVNRLRTLAMGYPPFRVELKNYGSFPSHTIYINVTSKLPIQQIVKGIRTESQRLMKLNDDNRASASLRQAGKPHFILEPHLTIARKLKPWQYEKGWLEYSQKHFTGRFIADEMILLKRPEGEKKYHPVQRFAFRNMPVETKQGELFSPLPTSP